LNTKHAQAHFNLLEFRKHPFGELVERVCRDERVNIRAHCFGEVVAFVEAFDQLICDLGERFCWCGGVCCCHFLGEKGVKFIESPRVPTIAADANNDKQYKTLVLGKQGLAEGVVREFGSVVTPSLDKFGRLFGLGWYGWAGWCIYREEAGAVITTEASQIAA